MNDIIFNFSRIYTLAYKRYGEGFRYEEYVSKHMALVMGEYGLSDNTYMIRLIKSSSFVLDKLEDCA